MAFDSTTVGALDAVRTWLTEYGLAAANAARLITGPRAADSVAGLVDEVREATSLSKRHRVRLAQLLGLLLLDDAASDDILVLPLHPDDPRAHEICRLADSLNELIASIEIDARRAA